MKGTILTLYFVVLGFFGLFFVLPIVIRARCIAMAADRGVSLTVDHVDIGIGEVRLVQVGLSLRGVPEIAAHSADARVTLAGLTPSKASIYALAVSSREAGVGNAKNDVVWSTKKSSKAVRRSKYRRLCNSTRSSATSRRNRFFATSR